MYQYIHQTVFLNTCTEFMVLSLIGPCKNKFHLFRFNRKVAHTNSFFSFLKIFNIQFIHVHVTDMIIPEFLEFLQTYRV